jgi:hypothetical protein
MHGHGSIVETAGTFSGLSFRGRPTKFTPERIQQIKNLVERGKSREDIAELVGVTVGSLAVTCSKLGVSLRRRMVNNGVRLLRPTRPVSGDGSTAYVHIRMVPSEFRNLRMGELIRDLILSTVKNDLFQQVYGA